MSVISSPPDLLADATQTWKDLLGVFGSISFLLFFGCVMDSIFIDNALKQIPNQEAFIELLDTQQHWLKVSTTQGANAHHLYRSPHLGSSF